jgi:hypothetical protein
MRCFGFNTTPDGKAGSQWNGVWSGYKNRDIKKSLSPYSVFRVTHFTPVVYAAKPTNRTSADSVRHTVGSSRTQNVRYAVKKQNLGNGKHNYSAARNAVR